MELMLNRIIDNAAERSRLSEGTDQVVEEQWRTLKRSVCKRGMYKRGRREERDGYSDVQATSSEDLERHLITAKQQQRPAAILVLSAFFLAAALLLLSDKPAHSLLGYIYFRTDAIRNASSVPERDSFNTLIHGLRPLGCTRRCTQLMQNLYNLRVMSGNKRL